MRQFKARSAKVDQVTATGCRPAGSHRFDCFYHASGETPTRATRCQMVVTLRGSGMIVRSVRMRVACRSRPILSESRARRVLEAELATLAAAPAELVSLARMNHGRFLAYAEWTRDPAAGEECSGELFAELSERGRLWAGQRNVFCRVAGAPVTRKVYFEQYVEPEVEVEPVGIVIGTGTFGGTFRVSGLTEWRGWGSLWATAEGEVELRNCLPTCIQGPLVTRPATVVLSGVQSRCGRPQYATIKILVRNWRTPWIGPYGVDCDGSLIFFN